MPNNASISVVIPLYNRAGLIAETLSTIEAQSLLPQEVIVVDDHSTDGSDEIVEHYKRTSRLNIINARNGDAKGVSGATNWGIRLAQGDFIALQDSDDLWMPTHLQTLQEALDRYTGISMAFSAIEVFGEAGDTVQKNDDFKASIKNCLGLAFQKDDHGFWVSDKNLLWALLMHGVPFRCQASLMRRKLIVDHSLFFDTDITYTQDAQFMTMAAYFTGFIYSGNVGLKLRRHAENDGDISYRDKVQKSYESRIVKLKDFFQNQPISVKEKKALNHRLWSLQLYIANQKAAGMGTGAAIRAAIELLRRVPTWNSMKSAVKLVAFNRG